MKSTPTKPTALPLTDQEIYNYCDQHGEEVDFSASKLSKQLSADTGVKISSAMIRAALLRHHLAKRAGKLMYQN